MSSKPVLPVILIAILVMTMLGGCNLKLVKPTATAAPTATTAATLAPTATKAPTIDVNLVSTQAAQTVVANLTQNAPSATPVTPTSSPTTTATITQTFTALPPTAKPTSTLIPWTKTPTATPSGYSCEVTSTTPKSTDTVKINTAFNWTWVIKNSGNWALGQHNADIVFVSGTKMQTGADAYNLPADAAPGASVTATIAMKTPSSEGTYTATWKIVQDGVFVCTLPLSVKVIN